MKGRIITQLKSESIEPQSNRQAPILVSPRMCHYLNHAFKFGLSTLLKFFYLLLSQFILNHHSC
jgi:hypothetical protein